MKNFYIALFISILLFIIVALVAALNHWQGKALGIYFGWLAGYIPMALLYNSETKNQK